ncbi:MAG: AraC family transcriptional regulator, partial [Kineothrix sp.]|nr:AraC family transcriptional regulator [Kineothrix sp.]
MHINDIINQPRIEKALYMFHEHIDNISYVAEQTGFNNAVYFSKKFKKATGLSPSEYIKTIL